MTLPTTDTTQRNFQLIKEGMAVRDSAGDEIGSVAFIQFGEMATADGEEVATTGTTGAPLADSVVPLAGAAIPLTTDNRAMGVGAFASVFGRDIDVPEEMAQRMYRDGFIRVKTGLLRSDRVAFADQVARVDAHVHLNVHKDDLLTV